MEELEEQEEVEKEVEEQYMEDNYKEEEKHHKDTTSRKACTFAVDNFVRFLKV